MREQIDDNILLQLYANGIPMHRISKLTGVSVGSVYNHLKKHGVNRPPHMGFKGKHHTESAKKKISAAHTGKSVSDETRQKISEAKKVRGIGHKKKRTDGYISLYYPSYPSSSPDGYVLEHRYKIEKKIGRFLSENEVVHHLNMRKDDNRLENLLLMTASEHMSLHMKVRHGKRRNDLSIR